MEHTTKLNPEKQGAQPHTGPAGGYLTGTDAQGNQIAHNDGDKGGILVGHRHATGGIKAINESTGEPIEVETGEVQIVSSAVQDGKTVNTFEGKTMTNKQVLSAINESGGGVAFAEKGMLVDGAGQPLIMKGGEVIITRDAVSSDQKHEFNGQQMTNREILSAINESGGGVAFAKGGNVPLRVKVTGANHSYDGVSMPDYQIAHSCGCRHAKKQGGPVSDSYLKGYRIESKEHYNTFKKLRAGKISPDEAVGEVVKEHLSENSHYYDEYKIGGETKQGPLKLVDIPANVKAFLPVFEQKALVGSEEHWELLDELDTRIAEMPGTYQTQNIPIKDKVLWLRYFYGDSEWYIAEKDSEPEQLQAFGYAILNGDLQNAEWGYINIEEIKDTGKIELDLYFTPTRFGDIDFGSDDRRAKNKPKTTPPSEQNKKVVPVSISINEGVPIEINPVLKRGAPYLYSEANRDLAMALKAQAWSNIPYSVTFADGEILKGVIDAEPYSFWKDKAQPFTWYLNYYWTNVAHLPDSKFLGYSDEEIDHVRTLLQTHDLGTFEPSPSQPVAKIPTGAEGQNAAISAGPQDIGPVTETAAAPATQNNMLALNKEATAAPPNDSDEIGPKYISITINGKQEQLDTYERANQYLKKAIQEHLGSNAAYEIVFTDGDNLSGVIDMEPGSFWENKPEPFTWHINYFWNNVAYDPEAKKMGYTDEQVMNIRKFLQTHSLGAFTSSVYQPIAPPLRKGRVASDKPTESTGQLQPKESKNPMPTLSGKSQAQINNEIRLLTEEKGTDRSKYSTEELALLRLYEGAGGLAKHGETGARLLDQFFKPNDVVAKMWGLALKYGFDFKNANVLDPAVGSGRFLSYIPHDTNTRVIAYDVDKTSYTICKVLYPNFDIRHGSFESMFFKDKRHIGLAGVEEFFDLVITNPPYREYVSQYAPLGEKAATGALTFEMYFIMRGVDVLKQGGLLVYIIPNTFLSNDNKYNLFKSNLAQKADLLDAYRLPSGIFSNTGVGTDIIVLRRK